MSQYLLTRTEPSPALRPVGRRRDAWPALSLPFVAFLFVPIAALLLRASPEQLMANLSKPQVLQAITLSLATTFTATGITILFGTPVAYLLARRRFRLRRAIDALVDLPTVLPPSVAGVALLMAFGRRGLLGGVFASLGIDIAFTQTAVVLAQVFIAAPFYIRAASVGFAGVSSEQEQAAAIDGANGWQVFRFITCRWPGARCSAAA